MDKRDYRVEHLLGYWCVIDRTMLDTGLDVNECIELMTYTKEDAEKFKHELDKHT